MQDKYLLLEEQAQPGSFSQYDIRALDKELQKLNPGSIYLEIGVQKGRSLSVTRLIRDDIFIHGVDIDQPDILTSYLNDHKEITFFRGDSVAISKQWRGSIDLLFIDGDHSYKGCTRDIEAWYPFMEKHGVILFHDYDISSPGVIQAVDEFAKANNLQVELCKQIHGNTSIAKIQL